MAFSSLNQQLSRIIRSFRRHSQTASSNKHVRKGLLRDSSNGNSCANIASPSSSPACLTARLGSSAPLRSLLVESVSQDVEFLVREHVWFTMNQLLVLLCSRTQPLDNVYHASQHPQTAAYAYESAAGAEEHLRNV